MHTYGNLTVNIFWSNGCIVWDSIYPPSTLSNGSILPSEETIFLLWKWLQLEFQSMDPMGVFKSDQLDAKLEMHSLEDTSKQD